MSARNFFIGLIIVVLMGTALFSRKIAAIHDSQDELENAMTDIKQVLLDRNSAAAYQDFGLGNETRFRIKYALAPAYLCTANFLTTRKYDTVLSAFPQSVSDSQRHSVLAGRDVLLERHCGNAIYVLTKMPAR